MRKRIILSLILITGIFANLAGLSVPALQGRVNDNAKLMTSSERQEAEDYLAAVEKQSGVQIAVLTVKSLQGESLEDYANDVFEKWGLGQKGEDNGVLLLVAYNERGVRIEVGYGLEGTLTDLKSGVIIRNIIIPEFKEGDYGAGILAGVKAVGGVVCGDVETENRLKESSSKNAEDIEGGLFAMIFVMVWFFIVFSSILRRYGLWGIFIWNLMGRHGPRPKRRPYVPNPHVTVHTSGFGGNFGGGGFGGGFSGGGGHSGGGGASGHW